MFAYHFLAGGRAALSVRKQVGWDGVTGPDQGRILLWDNDGPRDALIPSGPVAGAPGSGAKVGGQ